MKQQLIKEANEEFAKEFLKRLILVKLKQHYRNQDYSNSELEEEKFEKALKQMEEKSKEQKIVEMREQIKEKAVVKSTEVVPKEQAKEIKESSTPLPEKIIKPITVETKPVKQPKQEEKPKPIELPRGPLVREMAAPTISQPPLQLKPTSIIRPIPTQPIIAPAPKIITPAAPMPTAPIVSLAKLEPLMKDPTIQSIECPGENKPITVNRFGAIQTTSIILTKEEINNILKELSEKTRIPLTTGMFKVAYGSIIFTAVISEFVGTRFIIQRKEFA